MEQYLDTISDIRYRTALTRQVPIHLRLSEDDIRYQEPLFVTAYV